MLGVFILVVYEVFDILMCIVVNIGDIYVVFYWKWCELEDDIIYILIVKFWYLEINV